MRRWHLRLMVSESRVSTLELELDGEVLIGRLPPAEIVLEGATVSRRHCWLRIEDDGTVLLEDAGSSAGCFLNKQRLTGVTRFGDDDVLRVGLYELRLMSVAALG